MRGTRLIRFICILAAASLAGAWACSDEPAGLPANAPCTFNNDCVDRVCHSGICASPRPKSQGESCSGHGDCSSFNCVSGICRSGKVRDGQPCLRDQECQSRLCNAAGTCGKATPDGGPDRGPADAARPDAPPLDRSQPDLPGPDAPRLDLPPVDSSAPDKAALDKALPDMSQCGNGKLDPAELCDGALLGGKTCKTQGFTGGVIGCSSCALDLQACYKLGAPAILSTGKIGKIHSVRVATGSGGFFVVWDQDRYIRGAMLNTTGAASAPFLVHNVGQRQWPTVSSDGKDYMAVWGYTGNGLPYAMGAAGVTQAGTVQYPATSVKSMASQPKVAFNGTHHLILGSTGLARQLSTAGALLGKAAISVAPTTLYNADLATDGASYLAVWTVKNKAIVQGRFVDGACKTTGAAFPLATGATGGMYRVSAVHGGGSYLVVWEDTRNGGQDIIGALVSKLGKVILGNIQISTTAAMELEPTVAWTGKRFVVLWRTYDGGKHRGDVLATQITTAGKVVHKPAIKLASYYLYGQESPHLVYGHGKLVVAYRRSSPYGVERKVLSFGK